MSASGRNLGTLNTAVTNQPQGTPVSSLYGFKEKAYLLVPRNSRAGLEKALNSSSLASRYIDEGFWEFLITMYSEKHVEGQSLTQTMADSFVAFSTGANPVAINVGGYLYRTREEDHRANLLYLYHNAFRGTGLREYGIYLEFHIKNVDMKIYPLNLSVSETSATQDMTSFSMSAIAVQYTTQTIFSPVAGAL